MKTPTFTRRGLIGAGLGISSAAVLAACGGGRSANNSGGTKPPDTNAEPAATSYDGPTVTLAFWNGFTGGDGTFMKRIVDDFVTDHPNIKVTTTTMQWSDFYQKLPTAVQAGKGPDVAVMHIDQVATNAARQIVQPLDDVAKSLNLSESDFAPVPWKAGIYKGIRYSIPLDVHPIGFFYNKAVMEAAGLDPESPPLTHDDYMAALDKLKTKGIQGHWATPFPFTGSQSMQSLIYQFGASMYNDDVTKATWDTDGAIKAFTWWQDLIKKGYSPANVSQDADFLALQNGKNAFNWNGIWSINTLREKKDLQWGVSVMPKIGDTEAAWASSHQFTIPTQKTPDDNKQTAARVFVNWVSQQSLEWAKGGQVPARNSVRESTGFQELKEQAELAKQVSYLHLPPAIPGIGDASVEFDKALNEITLGGKDVADTLRASASRANKILDANAKKYQG